MRRRRLLTAALSGFALLLWACGSTNEGEYAAGDEDAALADGSGDQTTGDGAEQESAEEDLQSGAESGNDLSSFAYTGSTSYGDDAVPGVSLSADPPEFDEDAARGDARTEVHRRGYRGWCSDDCSGHEAGFEWAYENRLNRPQPTYDSESFDEGQEAYTKAVNRRVEEMREQFEDEGADSEYAQ